MVLQLAEYSSSLHKGAMHCHVTDIRLGLKTTFGKRNVGEVALGPLLILTFWCPWPCGIPFYTESGLALVINRIWQNA